MALEPGSCQGIGRVDGRAGAGHAGQRGAVGCRSRAGCRAAVRRMSAPGAWSAWACRRPRNVAIRTTTIPTTAARATPSAMREPARSGPTTGSSRQASVTSPRPTAQISSATKNAVPSRARNAPPRRSTTTTPSATSAASAPYDLGRVGRGRRRERLPRPGPGVRGRPRQRPTAGPARCRRGHGPLTGRDARGASGSMAAWSQRPTGASSRRPTYAPVSRTDEDRQRRARGCPGSESTIDPGFAP